MINLRVKLFTSYNHCMLQSLVFIFSSSVWVQRLELGIKIGGLQQ